VFDVGFWELVTLALIALLIVGPEKLPKIAHDVGQFVAKIRRLIHDARLELEKELDVDSASSLQDSIDHVERLMKEAPDRLLNDKDTTHKTGS